jgi:pyruvate dehydrogenase E2 component (dihydrolipoyllysine-residue acetyltransferase)
MDGHLVPLTSMRKAVAKRMTDSKQQAPHFYVQTEIAMDALTSLIEAENERGPAVRVTVTAALALACVAALRQEPRFNSVWTDEGLLEVDEINVGIAIALEGGLIAPALLGLERLDLAGAAAALRDLVERARAAKLKPAEVTDATFTLSNLGMFDVTAFTAIVTPPQVGILATGRAVERVVLVEGEPRSVSVLTATLSGDHRAVDGADAARFLEAFKGAIEEPGSLLSNSEKLEEARS